MNSNADLSAKNTKTKRRNPEKTRELLLETASRLIARDGPEGLSVSRVAQEAGLNRGSAYHHFDSREQLVSETLSWISGRFLDEIYGNESIADWSKRNESRTVIEALVTFAMENPAFGPTWLHRIFTDGQLDNDEFWKRFLTQTERFAESDMAEPGIDVEIHAFMMLVSIMMWPLWTKASKASAAKRKQLSERFIKEMLRMEVHGIVKPEKAMKN